MKDINKREDLKKGMVGLVGDPLQAQLKVYWEDEVKGHFNVRFFIFFGGG